MAAAIEWWYSAQMMKRGPNGIQPYRTGGPGGRGRGCPSIHRRVVELAVQAFALWSFACSSASGPSGLPVVPGEGGQASEGSDAAEAQSPPTTDGLAPIDVEAGDAGGAVDATAPPPSVDGLAPSEVTLGGTVTVVGTDFLPDPRVQLNGVLIVPSQVSATQMTIVVPADLPLSSCTESVSLLVQNDFGAAPPAVLQVDRPAPRIDAPGGVSVRAGGALSLTGAGLAGAMGALDGVGLATRASSPAAIVLNVPRATSPGHHALAVSGCGEADLDVLVLAPAPLILSADRTTIAANGVVRVTADVSNGARIDTVQVGTEPISTTDASSFQWQSQSYPTQAVFAVRMPSDLTPGSVNLRLGGAGAESDPYAIAVIAASPRSPPASSGIVFPPLKAADDPFPVSTMENFPEQDLECRFPNSSSKRMAGESGMKVS